MRSGTKHILVLVFEQPRSTLQLAVLRRLLGGRPGAFGVIDNRLTEPVGQGRWTDPEIMSDLLQRRPLRTLTGNPDDIVARLWRIRLGKVPSFQAALTAKPDQLSPHPQAVPSLRARADDEATRRETMATWVEAMSRSCGSNVTSGSTTTDP